MRNCTFYTVTRCEVSFQARGNRVNITEYKKHQEEMKVGDEQTWAREDSGLAQWEEEFGGLPLAKLDDATR
jgi:hypothetical protein